jgi:hypothetical protein
VLRELVERHLLRAVRSTKGNHPVSTAVYPRRGRRVVGVRDSSRPAFRQRGDLYCGPLGIDDVRIEAAGDPLSEFDVPFVLGVVDRIEEFGVAPGAAMASGGRRPVASINRG